MFFRLNRHIEDPNAAAEKRNYDGESSGEDFGTNNVFNMTGKKSPKKATRKAKAPKKKKSTTSATAAKKKKATMKTTKAKNGKKKMERKGCCE